MQQKIIIATVFTVLSGLAMAQSSPAQKSEASVVKIIPVFSQLVMLSYEKGFELVHEDAKEASYIQESVLSGESIKKWSQMITVSGYKELALNPNASPMALAEMISNGFRNVCPNSFSSFGPGNTKIDGHSAFITVTSCGTANPTDKYSESTLIIVLKGEKDIYTIQWSERGDASDKPLKFDQQKWVGRLQMLNPIKLCSRVQGEQAPYPSCLNRP